MKEIKISISMIVLLYKGSRYLRRIIEMYSENRKHFKSKFPHSTLELILVNDYPDEAIVLSQKDLEIYNINLVQNKKNMGIHRSKIKGLQASQGKLVFFLDQDDLISPYYFVEQYVMIGDCDAVICNMDWGEGPHYSKKNVEALDLSCYMDGNNAICSLGQVLLKKDAVPREWIQYPISTNGADDYYMIFIMLLKKQRMAEHRKVLYYHAYTGVNFSTNFKEISFSVIEVLSKLARMELLTQKAADTAIKKRKNEIDELLRAEEKYPVNFRQERRDNIRLINLYDKCLKNLESDYRLDSYIKTFRCNHVALYGAGKMGKHFMYWMLNTDTKVEIIIDKTKKGKLTGIPIIDLDEAQRKKDQIDMIVVTPMTETEKIITDLEKLFMCPIISLESAVYNMSCQLLESAHKSENLRFIINSHY